MTQNEIKRMLGAQLWHRIFGDSKREPLAVLALIRRDEPALWFGRKNRALAELERKLYAGTGFESNPYKKGMVHPLTTEDKRIERQMTQAAREAEEEGHLTGDYTKADRLWDVYYKAFPMIAEGTKKQQRRRRRLLKTHFKKNSLHSKFAKAKSAVKRFGKRAKKLVRLKNPRKNRSKNSGDIDAISQEFQGYISGETREMPASDFVSTPQARIGLLKSIVIDDGTFQIIDNEGHSQGGVIYDDFDPTNSYVGAESRTQLALLGKGVQFKECAPSEDTLLDVGEIAQITYVTNKAHMDGNTVVSYYHNLGEETGERPHLMLDHEGFPVIVGGAYTITREGIVN